MKIKKFEATKVHGYLEYDIDFNERLTFLIGINGTGKTSVLKLILGLISPSFNYLNKIEYESIKLFCVDDNNNEFYILSKPINEEKLSLSLNFKGKDPITGEIDKVPANLFNYISSEERNNKIQLLIDAFDEQPVVKEIKKITTPLFLGLDRRVYEGREIDRIRQNYLFRRRYREFPLDDPLNISLMDIQELIYDYVRIIASKQPQINQDFKNKILIQSFDFIDSQDINLIKDFKELKRKKEN